MKNKISPDTVRAIYGRGYFEGMKNDPKSPIKQEDVENIMDGSDTKMGKVIKNAIVMYYKSSARNDLPYHAAINSLVKIIESNIRAVYDERYYIKDTYENNRNDEWAKYFMFKIEDIMDKIRSGENPMKVLSLARKEIRDR
jgi:hypothetical protein